MTKRKLYMLSQRSAFAFGFEENVCVAQAMLRKPEVDRVTVIERAPEDVRLVAPHYAESHGERLEVIEADALGLFPRRGERWDVVWADIWDNISGDNLAEMRALRRRYNSRRAAWVGCWAYHETIRAAGR